MKKLRMGVFGAGFWAQYQIAAWQELDPALRQALVQAIERGALRNARKTFEIVTSYGRLDLICAIDNSRSIAGPACAETAAAAK